jgi:hypothetical protein
MTDRHDGAAERVWRGVPADLRQGLERDMSPTDLTTWTAQLTANAKERCLVSCIATERLAALGDC